MLAVRAFCMLLFRRLKTWRFTFRQRGVRPDAQREREHGHGGEAGVLQQLAERVAKVIKHRKEVPSEFRQAVGGSWSV